MKKVTSLGLFLLLVCLMPLQARALVPGGNVVGLQLRCGTVTVAEFEQDSPAQAAGVRHGDCILVIDDTEIHCAQDVKKALDCSNGTVTVTLRRGKEEKTLRIQPAISSEGPKLGIYLKEGITGIGTVTWYVPETGRFGTLGHGVNDPEGNLAAMETGSVYEAGILSVRKGRVGDPGQLMGSITEKTPIGELTRNTGRGLFGKLDRPIEGTDMETGTARTGMAVIRSNISGTEVREYSVEILKIYPTQRENGRNMLLKVTDPGLLESTGGIVQGMSGSPIIQDGKLVGAVTHVLVNDPTTGYGIFIENMLDAAA